MRVTPTATNQNVETNQPPERGKRGKRETLMTSIAEEKEKKDRQNSSIRSGCMYLRVNLVYCVSQSSHEINRVGECYVWLRWRWMSIIHNRLGWLFNSIRYDVECTRIQSGWKKKGEEKWVNRERDSNNKQTIASNDKEGPRSRMTKRPLLWLASTSSQRLLSIWGTLTHTEGKFFSQVKGKQMQANLWQNTIARTLVNIEGHNGKELRQIESMRIICRASGQHQQSRWKLWFCLCFKIKCCTRCTLPLPRLVWASAMETVNCCLYTRAKYWSGDTTLDIHFTQDTHSCLVRWSRLARLLQLETNYFSR